MFINSFHTSKSPFIRNGLPILLIIVIFLYSCAQIVPLSGGDRDVTPPKEVISVPLNGSTDFTANTIVIEFNEYIRLQNLSSQLIISPLLEETPQITVKGKKLIIKLKSELTPHTTYSFNFGNAIIDITENNAIPNFKYVFSTGTYIDSLSYSGHVIDAFELTGKENIYVLLYDQFNDSIPLKELPRYVSITDKNGDFSITNIAEGKYKVFALEDINSNYLYDLPNEQIAFKEEPIQIDSSSTENVLFLFKEDNELQYVKKAESNHYGNIAVQFNLPTNDLSFHFLQPTLEKEQYLIEKNKAGDSLSIWLIDPKNIENIELEIKDNNAIIDTVTTHLLKQEIVSDTLPFITTNVSEKFHLNTPIFIASTSPIAQFLSDSIRLYEDSILVPSLTWDSLSLKKFELAYQFKENTPYQLVIPPATFTTIYGTKNDTIIQNFQTKKESDYGNIYLKINPDFSASYFIELYKGNRLIRKVSYSGNETITYNYLTPGSYSLKLIVDENKNRRWDTGNYLEHLQPERVIFYTKDINIRANWDNEVIWNVKL